MTSLPRLIIGGVRSGEGKTTIALGIMAALRARGLSVQGCKVGPDYLDTGYQMLATGRPGRNLDLWMMGDGAVRGSVASHGGEVDIAVIEGVMGLFDGHRDGVTPTSTADVAKRIGAPVVLVIDAAHLAASAGAIALGYRTFDPDVQVVGVILNRWNPSRSRIAVEKAMQHAGLPILGYLPAVSEIALPSRHLGLVIADEIRDEVAVMLQRLGALITEYIDLDHLIEIANIAPPLPSPTVGIADKNFIGTRIAVARDEAFAFYYPENIELLQQAGAEIVYFSPLADDAIPDADGLYLGGGYPEFYTQRIADNAAMRESMLRYILADKPTYAECGGLLYLSRTLTDVDGCSWPMIGAVPRDARMHRRLQRMGYREGTIIADSLLGTAGTRLRGHEFHYSSVEPEEESSAAYLLDGRPEGYCRGNLFASYMHLHFAGCRQVVANWLTRCRQHQQERIVQ